MEIREYAFSQTGLQSLKDHSKGQNWPVVYLINNDKTSTSGKNKKAMDLNIPIISEEDFINMIGGA